MLAAGAADHLSSSECAQNKGSYRAQHSTWCMILSQSFGNNLDKYAFFRTDDIFEMHVNFVQNIYGWMTTKSRSRLLFKNLDICSPRQKYKAIKILNTNLQWWTIFSQQTFAKQWDSILFFSIKHEQQLSINWQRIKFNEILIENNSTDALRKTNFWTFLESRTQTKWTEYIWESRMFKSQQWDF